MNHELDVRYPADLAEAPAWARRLFHNVEFLTRRVTELEGRLAGLSRKVDSLATSQEVTAAAGAIPGEQV